MPQSMRFSTTAAILLLAGLVLAAPPKVVEEFTGKVIGVTDGDTIKVLVNKESVTVRLEGIDAPEAKQSFGNKSKEALAQLVAGKTVTVKKPAHSQSWQGRRTSEPKKGIVKNRGDSSMTLQS